MMIKCQMEQLFTNTGCCYSQFNVQSTNEATNINIVTNDDDDDDEIRCIKMTKSDDVDDEMNNLPLVPLVDQLQICPISSRDLCRALESVCRVNYIGHTLHEQSVKDDGDSGNDFVNCGHDDGDVGGLVSTCTGTRETGDTCQPQVKCIETLIDSSDDEDDDLVTSTSPFDIPVSPSRYFYVEDANGISVFRETSV